MNPADVWLREDFDSGTAYFPDDAGHFDLLSGEGTPVRSLSTLIVEGPTASARAMVTGSVGILSGGTGRQSVSSSPLPGPSGSSSSAGPPFFSLCCCKEIPHQSGKGSESQYDSSRQERWQAQFCLHWRNLLGTFSRHSKRMLCVGSC